MGQQCLAVCFCHPTVGNVEVSSYLTFSRYVYEKTYTYSALTNTSIQLSVSLRPTLPDYIVSALFNRRAYILHYILK